MSRLRAVFDIAVMSGVCLVGLILLPFATLYYWAKGDPLWLDPNQRKRPRRGGFWDHP